MLVNRYKTSPAKEWKNERIRFGYYTEPEIVKKSKVQSEMEEWYANDDLEEFGPDDNVEGIQQTGAEVDV